MDIVEALQKYDTNAHPSGETLPEAVRVYHVKVLCTFIKAGVPINKIDDFEISWKNMHFVLQEESQCQTSFVSF